MTAVYHALVVRNATILVMDVLLVALAALGGSIFSLIGGLYLIYGGKNADKMLRYAVPFAAGSLLAAAFLDVLPEAAEADESESVFLWVLIGIVFFFVLERGLRWFHHHHSHEDQSNANRPLIVIGDTLHNLLDGLALGAAFLVSPATGIIATIAVAAHEIPQEIGDFALLLKKGMRKRNVLLVNLASAVVTVIAAVTVFVIGSSLSLPLSVLLAATAGFFIYIATSDIIPSIHAETHSRTANRQTVALLAGIVVVGVVTHYLHQFIE